MPIHSSEFHPVAPGEQERNGFYHVEYPSDPDSVDRAVVEYEQELIRHYPFLGTDAGSDDFGRLSYGFREIAVNALYHGNLELSKTNGDLYDQAVAKLEQARLAKKPIEKKVRIDVVFLPTEVTAVIEDEGKGFNEAEIPDPTDEKNLLKTSGRGLQSTRELYDDVVVENTGHGTRVTLKKQIKLPK